ncbi:MAG: M1 family metallopeptidase [Bacteroidota bacterium]
MNKFLVFLGICFCLLSANAQFTHADSLRGGYGFARKNWDALHYELEVTFDIGNKHIAGSNQITFRYDYTADEYGKDEMQIDLQTPMVLDSIIHEGKKMAIRKDGNAYFFEPKVSSGIQTATIYFHGSPHPAKLAPWDGGIVWAKDDNNKDWISIACQGIGASVWYPCKDSQVDEPDSARMHYTVPKELAAVGNGRFVSEKKVGDDQKTYTWEVSNPINSYNIIPYIGNYTLEQEFLEGELGFLDVEYWVLKQHVDIAKNHFTEIVPKTLNAFEYWFGPYPFYEDKYKLVEAPFLGMEHQSAIAYGNGFKNGYLGTDLSETGEGLKWDFIVVHESGHEWFGNSITSKDVADMWIHESFTNYSEVLFMEYNFSKEEADRYCIGLRNKIENDIPIIGAYGVQNEGSGDMYYKGSNMLHTIRTLLGNDSLFREMLREMNEEFYHKTVTTKEIENFMATALKMELSPIFDQYLRSKNPPTLQVKAKKGKLKFRWIKVNKNFAMPILFGKVQFACSQKWSKWVPEKSKKDLNPNLYYLVK